MIEQMSTLVASRKSPSLGSKDAMYRMNSTWEISDEKIVAKGTLELPQNGMRSMPWKIVYQAKDSEPIGEDETVAAAVDWERKVRAELRLAKNQMIVFNGLWVPDKIIANVTSPLGTPFSTAELEVDTAGSTEETAQWKSRLIVDGQESLQLDGSYEWPIDNVIPSRLRIAIDSSVAPSMLPYRKIDVAGDFDQSDTGVETSLGVTVDEALTEMRVEWQSMAGEKMSAGARLVTPLQGHELYGVRGDVKMDADSGGAVQMLIELNERKIETDARLQFDYQVSLVYINLFQYI